MGSPRQLMNRRSLYAHRSPHFSAVFCCSCCHSFISSIRLGCRYSSRTLDFVLSHKIYLDRAFNYRDEKEVIYYFCLKNGKSWTDAVRLITDAEDLSKDYIDHTQHTQAISSSVDSFLAEQDLLEYIRQNGHNFEKNSVTASKIFNRYLSEAKSFVKDEISRYDLEHQNKWINDLSNNTLYEIITGLNITGKKGTKTVFNNATLPKEIKTAFLKPKLSAKRI